MARRSRWGRCSSWAVGDSPSTRDAAARHEPTLVSQPGRQPLPLCLALQKRELAREQGKPPSVRREYVEGHRPFPKDRPGVVGAVLPKDLPAYVEGPRGEVPLLVSPRSWAVFPAGRVTTRV